MSSELQEGLEAYADALATMVAVRVVAALQSQAPFTPEDIERIKDHVHPQGVAYKNGFKAGFARAAQCLKDTGARECTVSAAHLKNLMDIGSDIPNKEFWDGYRHAIGHLVIMGYPSVADAMHEVVKLGDTSKTPEEGP